MLWLFLYAVTISLYDLRTGRVPNWATLPILFAGVIAHFPGSIAVGILCVIVFAAWYLEQMAAGDAKLWMALFWAWPGSLTESGLFFFFISLLVTALLQLLYRKFVARPLTGFRTPGACRTIPFVLLLWYVH
jgi:Flp pilus assembly protein protease CpaA